MEDGKETDQPPNPADETGEESPATRRRNLRDATSLLKAEALKRYAENHRRSLDNHEEELAKDFAQVGRRAKKSPSPGPNTPDIAEEATQNDDPPNRGSSSKSRKSSSTPAIQEEPSESPSQDEDETKSNALSDDQRNPSPDDNKADDKKYEGDGDEAYKLPTSARSSPDLDKRSNVDSPASRQPSFHSHAPSTKDDKKAAEKTSPSPQSEEDQQDTPENVAPTSPDGHQPDDKKSPSPATSPQPPSPKGSSKTSTPRNESQQSPSPPTPNSLQGSPKSPSPRGEKEDAASGSPSSRSSVSPPILDTQPDQTPEEMFEGGEGQTEEALAENVTQEQAPAEDAPSAEPEQPASEEQNETESKPEETTENADAPPPPAAETGEGDTKPDESPDTQEPATESTEKAPVEDDKLGDAAEGAPAPEETVAAEAAAEEKPAESAPAEGDKSNDEAKPADEEAPVEKEASGEEAEAEKSAEEKPTDENPTEEKPAEEKPAEEQPTEEKPAEDKPSEEQSTEEKPAEEQPTAGKTTEEKPSEEAPAAAAPAEEAAQQEAQKEETAEEPKSEAGAEESVEKPEDSKPADEGSKEEGQDKAAEKDGDKADKPEGDAPSGVEAGQTTDGGTQADGQTEQGAQAEEAATEDKPAEEGAEKAEKSEEQKEEDEEKEDTPKPADGMDPNTQGDEDEIMSEQASVADGAPKIPDNHYYNYDELVSQARITEDSGLPNDLLTLHHSFGYDCTKRANLHMLDTNTAIFAAGNVVVVVNLKTKENIYLRSTSGGGIGALAVHPSKKYFAIAEKGEAPNINIIEFPSLKLYRILRGGTEKAYSYVDFSPDGKLLSSVGGDPDYMLTLWEWKQETITLRSKAFSQDVFRVTFSTELEGQLTSSGTGHIRFWKMAKTFTGLKLQGQLGKFGKKEISDIEGYVELPDGKVLSGSEWGNMCLWDGGLIKVEIARKGKKTCHQGSIQQIIMDEGELMTIGTDGFIRVWDFETIDTADAPDEADVFEMEPMNELKVGNDVMLRSIVKSVDPEEPTMWYAQDANGGIWKLDLSFSFTSSAPEKLDSYHAGPITGCGASPVSQLVATVGVDKTVRIYDYVTKEQLCVNKFNVGGSSLIWAPNYIDPKGATLITGFDDGVVRVLTFQKKEDVDVHGRKKSDSSELALSQAFKPHNGRVTAMAIDSKGEILATGGDDNTVFFLSIGTNYEPIGFIKTPSAVTHLEWTPAQFKKNKLLVCCVEGQVMEVRAPEGDNYDTTTSYQIEGLKIRNHHFKSVKSRLRHDEELARKAKEEEAKKKKEDEERRIRIERGLETESDNEGDDKNEEDEKEEEEEWSPYIPDQPSPILHGFHGKEEGKFWLSMGEFDAGYLYECEFYSEAEKQKIPEDQLNEPGRTIPLHNSSDVPIRCMKFSASGKHLILGMEDGSIRIQPLHNEDVGLMGPFWSLTAHDNHYGEILQLATSFDDKYLFSVGADGNFFVHEFMDQEKLDQKIADNKAKIPSAKKELADTRIDDIEDPSAYSIEDAKQKSEYDKMMKLAEEKKQTVRSTIEGLRDQFKKLSESNLQLPEHLRLDRKEFEMDPEIKRELQRHTQAKVDQVNKEMAWEEEKHRVALEKLRCRFKDVVECERIVVKAFKTQHEVASFRAAKLSDDFYTAKAEMEKRKTTMMSKDEASRQATQDLLMAQKAQNDGEGGAESKEKAEAKIVTTLKGSMGERITKALAKVEEKKRKRAARRAQWSDLHTEKPDDDYEDPNDLAAIKEAQENMGDYKLKSADDYVVPDHLRMNTDKARSRLLLLKELIHQRKYEFNKRLLALRDKKIAVIEDIRSKVGQLAEVQGKLGPEKSKQMPNVPEMHPDELPEKKYEYTRESLIKFKAEYEAKKAAAKRGGDGGDGVGGFGGFGGGGAQAPDKPSPTPPSTAAMYGNKQASVLTTERTMEPENTMSVDDTQLSDLEKKLKVAEEIRLLYDRDRLFRDIEDKVKNFDAELRCIRHEKFKLDIDLKNADLRHVTLFEELLLLKDFEKRENILADKVEAKEQEKHDMQQKILDVQNKLESKKKEIEKCQEKEKTLHATFVGSLGENNKFAEYLTKVFKKRIKRSKKKAGADGEGSDDDSDDDSDDESDWSESDEESDSESGGYDLDVCPPGCDQNLYDNTCALREKRLDIEEALAEEKKNRDAFNKELENLQKKAKVIDSGLKGAEQELEAFQLEKQRKLNELDVVVTLKLHQIQHINNGVLPQDLSQCLVFEASGVVRLQHRIKELEHEKALQKKQQKDSKKKHVQLIKDRRVFDARISEMEEQTNKMMLQKFGRIVDLEKLETVTVNRQVEELKEKLRVNELQCSNEIVGWEDKIQDSKDDITLLIRANTDKLDQLNMLLGEKKNFEGDLDSRQKNLGSEYTGARKADVHERQRLIQLVHLQAQEIEALKEEIMLLSRKGGHILPPAQPPMPQSAQGTRSIPN